MSPHKFILNAQGEPVVETDLLVWAKWFETENRSIATDIIGTCLVSTVFLGLDHNYDSRGGPVLWETMVFGGPAEVDHCRRRCSGTREQAEAMHFSVVNEVKAAVFSN
jgi:hypothetical protein